MCRLHEETKDKSEISDPWEHRGSLIGRRPPPGPNAYVFLPVLPDLRSLAQLEPIFGREIERGSHGVVKHRNG
jgi:hypothetical protein